MKGPWIIFALGMVVAGILLATTAIPTQAAGPERENTQQSPMVGDFTGSSSANGNGSGQGLLSHVSSDCLTKGSCSVCEILQVAINVGNFMLAIAGALTLLFFIWGAWEMLTARGDDEKITAAKGILWSSLAGMVFVLIAWEVVATILYILTGNKQPFSGICNMSG